MQDDKGTPIVNLDELEPELTEDELRIPTQAELDAKQGKSDADNPTAKDGAKEEDDPDAEADKGEPDEPAQATQELVPSVEDPGEFQPGDYAFEVTVFDEKNEHPKTKKISSIEDWDALLESDPNLGSPAALLKAQRLATKMEQGLEADKREYNTKLKAYNDEQAKIQAQTEQLDQWQREFDYLVDQGELPKIATKYKDADWSDPEVAKQPGVAEQLAVMTFMQKENSRREKAGIKPLNSILDAYYQYDRQAQRTAKADEKKAQGQQRRDAGARVAGPTASPAAATRKGVMVGQSLGSLDNLSSLLP